MSISHIKLLYSGSRTWFLLIPLMSTCWSALADMPDWVDTNPLQWVQGSPPTDLKPRPGENHFFCVLSKIAGEFQGDGESVTLHAPNWDWILGGSSNQLGVRGNAYCFNTHGFASDTDYRHYEGGWAGQRNGKCDQGPSTRPLGTGNAATFISGISGNWEGPGEWVSITQNSDPGKPSLLEAHTCGGDKHLRGHAISYSVDQRVPARFWGGTFKASAAKGSEQSVDMVPADQAMCGFTRVSGKFRGAGESVDIVPNRNQSGEIVWRLNVHAASDSGIEAEARCFARDQRASSKTSPGDGSSNAAAGGNQSAGNDHRFPTCAQATYHFCVTPPGSGGVERLYNIDACSPDEAEAKLLKQLGGIDWKVYIHPGDC